MLLAASGGDSGVCTHQDKFDTAHSLTISATGGPVEWGLAICVWDTDIRILHEIHAWKRK